MPLKRRRFMHAGALGLTVSGALAACTARMPNTSKAPSSEHRPILDSSLMSVADAIGEALVPGAAAAGFASYLDTQLARPAQDSLLIARYLGIEAPYRNFYLAALNAIETWSQAHYGSSVTGLSADRRDRLVQDLADGTPTPWNGAPAAFVHFVLRADAIDVAYGTRSGFARLDIPYMAHIEPEQDW